MKKILRNRITWAVMFSLVALSVPGTRFSFAYVTDKAVHSAPNYTTFRPPAKGGSYTDPVFGTAVKRISDAMNTTDTGRGGTVKLIAQEYSTMSPFNMDNT